MRGDVGMAEIKCCKRCGKKLRSEESKKRGYGKICWEKAQQKSKPLFSLSENKN